MKWRISKNLHESKWLRYCRKFDAQVSIPIRNVVVRMPLYGCRCTDAAVRMSLYGCRCADVVVRTAVRIYAPPASSRTINSTARRRSPLYRFNTIPVLSRQILISQHRFYRPCRCHARHLLCLPSCIYITCHHCQSSSFAAFFINADTNLL